MSTNRNLGILYAQSFTNSDDFIIVAFNLKIRGEQGIINNFNRYQYFKLFYQLTIPSYK